MPDFEIDVSERVTQTRRRRLIVAELSLAAGDPDRPPRVLAVFRAPDAGGRWDPSVPPILVRLVSGVLAEDLLLPGAAPLLAGQPLPLPFRRAIRDAGADLLAVLGGP